MMNMEWSILPGYAREEEIRELFTCLLYTSDAADEL